MLCLDIKLVSRLRGVSLTSGSSTNVSAVSLSVSSTSSTTVDIEKKNFSSKRNKGGRESCAGNGNSVTESDSDEETLLPASRTIQRNRSRSVCVPALSSAARCAHLHRRSSHHAYVSLNIVVYHRCVSENVWAICNFAIRHSNASNPRYFIYSIYWVCRYEALPSNRFDENTYRKLWNLCWKNAHRSYAQCG